MRVIGLDIHRAFAEAIAWDDGKLNRLGRVDMRHLLEAFAKKLTKEDVVPSKRPATRPRSRR
jgi:transposase